MLIGNQIHRSSTPMTVTIFMIKNVAPTAQNVSGPGQSATPKVGSQTMQRVAAKPRRLSSGVQVVKTSQMDFVEQIALSVARLASLMIQIQQKHADARPGKIHDCKFFMTQNKL